MGDERIETASTMVALGQTRLSAPGAAHETPGTQLGDVRFRKTGALGAGGMGVVDGVWDGDLLRELAIKRIRPELRADPRVIAMFLWEARVTAYLEHPNIVPVHDLGLMPDRDPYYVMKRVAGASLETVLTSLRAGHPQALERWTLARRIRAFHQICGALAFAHRRGVLHRDLKPANVMLGESGEVVVMDWGLAVPLPGPAGERLRAVMPAGFDSVSAGTPLYMSPEQQRGEILDDRSDVYSLGVMLYELASLAKPRTGDWSVRDAWPDAPSALAAIVATATQRDRADRYPTVAALIDDLERFMDGGSPAAEHAPRARRFARFYVSRDRRLTHLRVVDIDMIAAFGMAVGVACGAAFASAIGSWWWLALVAAGLAAILPLRAWRRGGRERT